MCDCITWSLGFRKWISSFYFAHILLSQSLRTTREGNIKNRSRPRTKSFTSSVWLKFSVLFFVTLITRQRDKILIDHPTEWTALIALFQIDEKRFRSKLATCPRSCSSGEFIYHVKSKWEKKIRSEKLKPHNKRQQSKQKVQTVEIRRYCHAPTEKFAKQEERKRKLRNFVNRWNAIVQ